MARFAYECALRWSDLDAFGHINNARFLTLYEEARVALFFTGAGARGLTSFEEGIVIARHEVDYLRPVAFGAGPDGAPRPPTVRIELWISEVRPSRFVVDYELFDVDTLASRARSVCVPYNLDGQHPRRLSETERAFLDDWRA
jgi:acyl-CoA thioester hydrolase